MEKTLTEFKREIDSSTSESHQQRKSDLPQRPFPM